MNESTRKSPDNEEPELGNEESVPLDGKDPVGEKMMDDLGRERASEEGNGGGAKQPAAPGAGREDDPGPLPEQLPVS
jgi:hypothetical protein